jgi:anti-sigma B factor antagonist
VDLNTDPTGQNQLMTIATARQGDVVIVTVAGEIDLVTADRLLEAVNVAFDEAGDGPVIVDLQQVGFLGSSGLAALIDAQRRANRHREPLRIVVDHTHPVIRPLQLSGLDNVLTLFEDLADALLTIDDEPAAP